MTTLATPAKTVFAVLKAAKELKTKEHAEFMHDMVGVVCAGSADQKYIDALRKFWRDLANDSVPEFKQDRVTYDGDTPRIPWKQATALMFQQLAVMKKVKGHG